jgi:hypothetical protein
VLLPAMLLVATVIGVLLGGRASAEDGRSAARTALSDGNAARAVSLDEAVAGRSGLLMALDPGASSAASREAQQARIAWGRQLAKSGDVDAAVAALAQVSEPSLISQAAQARAQILIDAATVDIWAAHAQPAHHRLTLAAAASRDGATLARVAALRSSAEVAAAAELVAARRAPDALALLDDAAAHGAAAAAAYPATLLAAAQAEIPLLDFQEAAATLQRLLDGYGSAPEAQTARQLMAAPQSVAGTLVDSAGHGAAGRVRLSTHFTQLNGGGYVTGGPFYTGTSNSNGDFTITNVPVGGPYVLEYYRDGSWMTLVDPRTGQPANPVTVAPLAPQDLAFIVLP